ncbi:MAG: hypothetical protein K6F93_01685 [Lachnospiraceae bacterium]|nr:hypothetical protein [Lachnospiraceae bacterium]
MNLRLIKLTKEYETQVKEMIEEWKADIIANNTNRSPWVIFKNDCNDFIHYLENLETKEETDTWVPDSVVNLMW